MQYSKVSMIQYMYLWSGGFFDLSHATLPLTALSHISLAHTILPHISLPHTSTFPHNFLTVSYFSIGDQGRLIGFFGWRSRTGVRRGLAGIGRGQAGGLFGLLNREAGMNSCTPAARPASSWHARLALYWPLTQLGQLFSKSMEFFRETVMYGRG